MAGIPRSDVELSEIIQIVAEFVLVSQGPVEVAKGVSGLVMAELGCFCDLGGVDVDESLDASKVELEDRVDGGAAGGRLMLVVEGRVSGPAGGNWNQ